MIRRRAIAVTLAVTLATAVSASAVAQEEVAPTPEGVDWALTSFMDPDTEELTAVPFGVRPTLRLESGVASGFAGCNQFSGGFEMEGTSLRISDELSVTLALCEEDVQLIEDAYLAALGEVDGWLLDGDVLKLSDDFGTVLLELDVPDILWTSSQMTAFMTMLDEMTAQLEASDLEIETLRQQLQAVNVVRLRERIKTLETDNKALKQQVSELESNPPASNGSDGGSAFSQAERVLLEGIPRRIASTCAPLRSSLPEGTRAAVACRPNTSAVASLDYYLMEGEDAAAAYQADMSANNVPQAASSSQTCEQGVKSRRQWLAGGWQADGCYRIEQKAEVRFIDNATDCRKLRTGGRTLQSPAVYMELQGSDRDIERVYGWATRDVDESTGLLTSLTVPIERPNAAISPSCPT